MDKAAPIELDLRRDLPKVRAALGDLELGACLYSAPCAVGVMMTPEQRAALEDLDGVRVGMLLGDKIKVPVGQGGDFTSLQMAFDNGSPAGFETTLAALEAKYLEKAS